MENEEQENMTTDRSMVHATVEPELETPKREQTNRTTVVAADSVEAEEIPTIPIESLQTINALHAEISVHSVASMQGMNKPIQLVTPPSEYQRKIRDWIQIWSDGMRLKYTLLPLVPFLAGSALAWINTINKQHLAGSFQLIPFILAIVAIILIQVGANLANDYYDHQRGVDTSNVLGPGGLIQQGLIRPTAVLRVGLIFLLLGAVAGLIAGLSGGIQTILLGFVALICAYFYSASNYSLARLGLGELVSFLIFGPLSTMSGYMIQTHGTFSTTALIYSVAFGLLITAIIHANNMRDIEGDQHAGKRTLAILIGMNWSRLLFIILLILVYALVVMQGIPHGAPHLILITLWTLPATAVITTGIIRTEISSGFHLIMLQTLKLLVAFGILLIVALAITRLLPILPTLMTLPFKLPF